MATQFYTVWKQITLCLLINILPVLVSFGYATGNEDLWSDLGSGNHFVILRHALAPGTGDPPEFDLKDCRTQRNLSEQGRMQAEAIGQRFRDHGYSEVRVYSSEWCRCLETARLLDLGEVKELPVLNSFFSDFDRKDEQNRLLKEWLAKQDLREIIVLVSHQVNVTALTGIFPQSGQLVIIERKDDGGLIVKGSLLAEY